MRRPIVVVLACGLVVGGPAAASRAAKTKLPHRPTVIAVEAPLGLQGVAGAGANVTIPFVLYDRVGRRSDVEVQYAFDRNGDGRITTGAERHPRGTPRYPNEYALATEDRLDPRDTRENRVPQLFESSGDIGGANAFVWKSTSDLNSDLPISGQLKLTPQGRPVPDPDNPGSFLPATGPDGSVVVAGLRVRMRAVTRVHRSGRVIGSTRWAYSDAVSLDNDSAPSMTIDGAASDTTTPSLVMVRWTVFDRDSEDFNGNGVLDVANGEDADNDGRLDEGRVGVAFDWHRLTAGESPATMSPAEMAALSWSPCTRAAGVGDNDSLDARPGVPIPASGNLAGVPSAPFPAGRHWLFAWDTAADVGATSDSFILRATPFDEHRRRGATFHSQIVVRPGQ